MKQSLLGHTVVIGTFVILSNVSCTDTDALHTTEEQCDLTDPLIRFAERDWHMKESAEPKGPGSNYWSPQNVHEEDGVLELFLLCQVFLRNFTGAVGMNYQCFLSGEVFRYFVRNQSAASSASPVLFIIINRTGFFLRG